MLTFNLFGYKIWYYYASIAANNSLQASIDNKQYEDKDLVTIKVPLSLPYFTEWKDFERYDGSIDVNGQRYNYVKRKVSNDTLILLCIPNTDQNKLADSKNNYENLLSNIRGQQGQNGNANVPGALVKSLLLQYVQVGLGFHFSTPCNQTKANNITNENTTCRGNTSSPWRPPAC